MLWTRILATAAAGLVATVLVTYPAAGPATATPAGPGTAPGTSSADTQPPGPPVNLRIIAVTSSSITIAWDPCSDNVGVTGYDILRGQGRQSHRVIATITGTTFVNVGLGSQVTYSYLVRARDAAGNRSTLSNGVTAVTLG